MKRAENRLEEYVFLFNDFDDAWMRNVEESERRDEESGWFS
ncbi:MAG: hypothetical protein ACP5N3_00010 [Candidatus Nanoarchaeia archaeon]